MRQMALRMDDKLWSRLEAARGRVPRERYVRDLLEKALGPVAASAGLPGVTVGVSAAEAETSAEVPDRPASVLPKIAPRHWS